MKNSLAATALVVIALAGCRGEPVPRDYQNTPPAIDHPVDSSMQAPDSSVTSSVSPEPSSGAEGTSAPSTGTAPPPTTTTVSPTLPPNAETKNEGPTKKVKP